ncbi:hypothetical protein SODALDRAFT_380771 [Sodiomyces alkalinus F11]|uniref:Uncharacterized protein n=1 Tax=Sodiomyces alkalinus (strain CBS 110278 / VKM F-3762 / F11) TaxID=1314773 RepID=A0A3N2PPM2_SODAK|nr:hypothetical protein SODALDRAFT_380771 [Sodiomyces alkalinus F11]ROT36457.1 hypothetical protein SODALDRAFT_380771 [Sodiomyces alkalinus F11]
MPRKKSPAPTEMIEMNMLDSHEPSFEILNICLKPCTLGSVWAAERLEIQSVRCLIMCAGSCVHAQDIPIPDTLICLLLDLKLPLPGWGGNISKVQSALPNPPSEDCSSMTGDRSCWAPLDGPALQRYPTGRGRDVTSGCRLFDFSTAIAILYPFQTMALPDIGQWSLVRSTTHRNATRNPQPATHNPHTHYIPISRPGGVRTRHNYGLAYWVQKPATLAENSFLFGHQILTHRPATEKMPDVNPGLPRRSLHAILYAYDEVFPKSRIITYVPVPGRLA